MNVCNDLWSIRRYASWLNDTKCIFQGGLLIPLFWTSGDASSGFQSHSGQPYSHFAEVYVLHDPWGSTLVWHLPTSWWLAWQLSCALPHTCDQALVGLKPGIYCTATASHCESRQTLYPLSYAGSAIEAIFKYQVFESKSRSKMLKILNLTKFV